MIRLLLTHPGGAHKDDFLACSVLLALHPVPIERREVTVDELADPSVFVVDVGFEHSPERGNFDHHQFPKDHPPTCSLSLVLQHLGLYVDARLFCDWLEPTEWFDCRGPIATAKWLGVERSVLDQLISPIDITLLRRFASSPSLQAGDPLWEVMRMVGEDLLSYLRTLRERLDFIAENAEVWTLEIEDGPLNVLFLPRTDPLPDDPSMGIHLFIESLSVPVAGMIYPDRRSEGYGLSRYEDHPRLDFTRVADHPKVHFAHARGFIAKTTATDPEELQALMRGAWIVG